MIMNCASLEYPAWEAGEIMQYSAKYMNTLTINEHIQKAENDITFMDICAQRYLAAGSKGKHITLHGTCGNATGCFLDGSLLEIFGNAQEALGDTMNEGKIIVHGSCGDALAYGMRGGKIFIEGNCGSRCGIHMKAYQQKSPVVIIGGTTKDFFGEYLAGGTLIVLNLQQQDTCCGKYCGVGAHGGKIYLRLEQLSQANCPSSQLKKADVSTMQNINEILAEYASDLSITLPENMTFYERVIESKNPYEGLYVDN